MTAGSELLSVSEMYEADRLTIEGGTTGVTLMEAAGKGIADFILENWNTGSALILCGPGNNGGDGYVVARLLQAQGWKIDLVAIGDPAALKGDAAVMKDQWSGDIHSQRDMSPLGHDLVVDSVFGAGFSRRLPDDIRSYFREIVDIGIPVVAVDVPSGVNGTTGEVDEGALPATHTVTFFRPKIGHYLYPGRSLCGDIHVIDIGINLDCLEAISPQAHLNSRNLWQSDFSLLKPQFHKYSRGHAAVVGGGVSSTGAARLAARACLRAGAGAVTVVTPPSALMTYAAALEAVMVTSIGSDDAFLDWLESRRIGTVLIGPGNGVTDRTRSFVIAALQSDANVILDADALTVFQEEPNILFQAIASKREGNCILTPHEAEFARLFSKEGSKLERAVGAANQSGAVILLKGPDTVIAMPEGKAIINHNAPPFLATAGSGDVLAGIISGLVSSRMPAFLAAAAGAWIHGKAAQMLGSGMIAEDIEAKIPDILAGLVE
ncbi:MAG: NAD(P)H-hydrate dehydratase [Proteobacteria bacterium]|nr:NAD(P)H-hydrate dehydratase [Pseudomonadota bacterium]